MTTEAVRYDRLQFGLAEYVLACCGVDPVWSGEVPRESLPARWASLVLISGPRTAGLGSPSIGAATLPLTATATVTAATVGQSATLAASGRRFSYRAVGGDDVTTVRDGLLAAIEASPGSLVSATFTASGTDAIEIAATSLGDLYNLAASGLLSLVVDTDQVANVQTDDVEHTVRLQFWSTSRHPRTGANPLLARFLGALQLVEPLRVLDSYGLGVRAGNPINLDALAGPRWESRAAVDLAVTQVSVMAAEAGQITEVRSGILVRTALSELTIEVVGS